MAAVATDAGVSGGDGEGGGEMHSVNDAGIDDTWLAKGVWVCELGVGVGVWIGADVELVGNVLNGGGSGGKDCRPLRIYPVYSASPSNVCGGGDEGGVTDTCEKDDSCENDGISSFS